MSSKPVYNELHISKMIQLPASLPTIYILCAIKNSAVGTVLQTLTQQTGRQTDRQTGMGRGIEANSCRSVNRRSFVLHQMDGWIDDDHHSNAFVGRAARGGNAEVRQRTGSHSLRFLYRVQQPQRTVGYICVCLEIKNMHCYLLRF